MSIVEPTLLSLARAALVSLATMAVFFAAGPALQSWPRKARQFTFWMAMATLLAPGFAVALWFYKDVLGQPDSIERTYCGFVMARYFQAALLALWLFPAPMSDEALHALQLGNRGPWLRRRVQEWRAWGKGPLVAGLLVFLLAFQEFEIATTWNLRAWTVALFDAQAGGLALTESLRISLLPLAIQTALIAMLCFARRGEALPGIERRVITSRSCLAIVPMLWSLCFALFPIVLFIGGMDELIHAVASPDLAPWREIVNALIISSTATAIAWMTAGWIHRLRGWRWLLALPGLLGPLLCGLLLLALIQVPPLHLLRDTAFPAVLGLALVLLPYALVLRFGIETTRDGAALHAARASDARRALWQLDGWPRLCAVLLLFCFGFGDFTINALLAPPQFTSVSARLLNLLHYGRSDALMTMFILAFAVPLSFALLTALAARFYPHRRAS